MRGDTIIFGIDWEHRIQYGDIIHAILDTFTEFRLFIFPLGDVSWKLPPRHAILRIFHCAGPPPQRRERKNLRQRHR